jgi:hypothetical protein
MTAKVLPRKWTAEEDERLQAMALAGRDVFDIAGELDRTTASVYARAHGFGLSLRRMGSRRTLR